MFINQLDPFSFTFLLSSPLPFPLTPDCPSQPAASSSRLTRLVNTPDKGCARPPSFTRSLPFSGLAESGDLVIAALPFFRGCTITTTDARVCPTKTPDYLYPLRSAPLRYRRLPSASLPKHISSTVNPSRLSVHPRFSYLCRTSPISGARSDPTPLLSKIAISHWTQQHSRPGFIAAGSPRTTITSSLPRPLVPTPPETSLVKTGSRDIASLCDLHHPDPPCIASSWPRRPVGGSQA